MIDFLKIDYLKFGNGTQKVAHAEITGLRIFDALFEFRPVVAGTIPIGIQTCNSDLDIICEFRTREHFAKCLISLFGNRKDFIIKNKEFYGIPSVVARFQGDYFNIEIFGQAQPIEGQHAYRHMLIEHRLLKERGPSFRRAIIRLKNQGFKTEPAFAKLLGLEGDPYLGLLSLE
jgi:hypothetical protein